ncbi:MAG: putative selenium-dependent hydroxylase accessory protein YqeC [Chloroflexi bacterium]|nr:putative selenium-dependent hydroxylase accessory protein YqeC [Chloroflexota bacterium]
MNLLRTLRIAPSAHVSRGLVGAISLVGAGGKTTALFQLARQFIESQRTDSAVIVTATTHLGAWQTSLADHHLIATDLSALENIPLRGVTLITGEIENDRVKPISETTLSWLRADTQNQNVPLLIEADGSRQKPIKAPAEHEPPIPTFTDMVMVFAGLSVLGKPLTHEHVHRAEIFSQLNGLKIGQPITAEAITRVLTHPQGGLKNIPPTARRVALLNQADTPELQSIGGGMARELLGHFDSVVVGSLQSSELHTFEHCAGIILAAGKSSRYGSPKQLLDWKGKPFVRQVAETALQAGLWPVVVVTGFHAADVESTLSGLPVSIVHNPEYQQGQSTSIHAGIQFLPKNVGSAIFLLADQPQIPVDVIRALIESHTREMQAILAPLVLEERRANPVLFDRVAFPDLLKLTGDVGGRAIFDKHRVEYLPWHDDILLFDVDKPEDYQRLKDME